MDEINVEKDNNTFKVNMLGALIITISLVVIGISSSYAYFSNSVTKTNGDAGLSITSGNLKMSFTKSTPFSNAIANLVDAIPKSSTTISLEKLKASAHHTDFTIAIDSNSAEKANFELYLTDITVSENLKNKYLNYALYKGTTLVKSGDFGTATGTKSGTSYSINDITLIEKESITRGTSIAYVLYVWLEDDVDVNQAGDCKGVYTSCTDLRNGTFGMKVGFKGNTKTT